MLIITVLGNIESNTTNKQSSNHARSFQLLALLHFYCYSSIGAAQKQKIAYSAIFYLFTILCSGAEGCTKKHKRMKRK